MVTKSRAEFYRTSKLGMIPVKCGYNLIENTHPVVHLTLEASKKIVTRSLEGAGGSIGPPFYFRHNLSDWHETWYI